MDWYSGCGDDDLMVPSDGGLSDRLPSPDSWSRWGISAPETFHSQYKYGAFGTEFFSEVDGFNKQSISNEVVMEDFQLESGSVDDFFLSSLQEDCPGYENLDESFCASPKSAQREQKFDNLERDVNLEFQNSSGDVLSLRSSRYLKTRAFSPSSSSEKDCSSDSEIVANNLNGKGDPFSKDPYIKESTPSAKNSMSGHNDEETSDEEAVLLELKMVMNQLTDKTRICFRDSLYRLAKNWDQPRTIQNRHGDLFSMEIPPRCNAEMTRSVTKRSTELETNGIDRAVASLMFNNTGFNIRDFPIAVNEGEIGRASEPIDFDSYPSHINYSSDHQVVLGDAEVPIFGQTYQCPTKNFKNGNDSKKSLVLNFGSVTE